MLGFLIVLRVLPAPTFRQQTRALFGAELPVAAAAVLVLAKAGKFDMSGSRVTNLEGREVPIVYRYVENAILTAEVFRRCGCMFSRC